MEIVVVSDSYGCDDALEYILQQHGDVYAYIYCGDINTDPGAFPRFVMVGGNNDIFYDYLGEQILSIGAYRIFTVHPHQFTYSHRSQQLANVAKECSCDIVRYGHTHTVAGETVDGIRLTNPRSLWRSRDGRGPSYALLNIDGDTVDVQFEFLLQKQKKSKFFWQDKPYTMRLFSRYQGFKSQG